MTTRHLRFNHDVIVEVFRVYPKKLYDFNIYIDINRDTVVSDPIIYHQVLDRLEIKPIREYSKGEIKKVLREIKEVTSETD